MKYTLILALLLSNWVWFYKYHQVAAEDKRLLDWNHEVETKWDCSIRHDLVNTTPADETVIYVENGMQFTYINGELREIQYPKPKEKPSEKQVGNMADKRNGSTVRDGLSRVPAK